MARTNDLIYLDRGHTDAGPGYDGASVLRGPGDEVLEVDITTPVWSEAALHAPVCANVVPPAGSFAQRAAKYATAHGIWISLHCNAGDPKWRGFRAMHAGSPKMLKLGERAMQLCPSRLRVPGRKSDIIQPKDPLYPRAASYIYKFTMPVLILELGYLTNAEDLAALTDPDVQTQLALFVAQLTWEAKGIYGF